MSSSLNRNNENPSTKTSPSSLFCCVFSLFSSALPIHILSQNPIFILRIFQIIQCSCGAVQREYFQETLGRWRKNQYFDLARGFLKQLSIMTFTRLHTCPWQEPMEGVSLSFCLPSRMFRAIFLSFGPFHKKVMDYTVTSPLFSSSRLSLALSRVMECGTVAWFITSWRLWMASL